MPQSSHESRSSRTLAGQLQNSWHFSFLYSVLTAGLNHPALFSVTLPGQESFEKHSGCLIWSSFQWEGGIGWYIMCFWVWWFIKKMKGPPFSAPPISCWWKWYGGSYHSQGYPVSPLFPPTSLEILGEACPLIPGWAFSYCHLDLWLAFLSSPESLAGLIPFIQKVRSSLNGQLVKCENLARAACPVTSQIHVCFSLRGGLWESTEEIEAGSPSSSSRSGSNHAFQARPQVPPLSEGWPAHFLSALMHGGHTMAPWWMVPTAMPSLPSYSYYLGSES